MSTNTVWINSIPLSDAQWKLHGEPIDILAHKLENSKETAIRIRRVDGREEEVRVNPVLNDYAGLTCEKL